MILAKVKRMFQKYEVFVLTSSTFFQMQISISWSKLLALSLCICFIPLLPPDLGMHLMFPTMLAKAQDVNLLCYSGCPPQFCGFEVWSQRTLQIFGKAESLNSPYRKLLTLWSYNLRTVTDTKHLQTCFAVCFSTGALLSCRILARPSIMQAWWGPRVTTFKRAWK